jgi:phosphate starvation-inducible PhoH-like protein
MLHNIEGIGIVEFGKKDIIRHSLVSQIVKAFDSHEEDSATNDHHKADNN